MANALGTKSLALDQSYDVIEDLKQELAEYQQRVKKLELENKDL